MNGDRNLIINPELVAYAMQRHNYAEMAPLDQVRLNIIRLEIDRIRIEMRRGLLQYGNDDRTLTRPRCPVCLEEFNPHIQAMAAICGHVYCYTCQHQIILRGSPHYCAVCRSRMISLERIFMRFAFNSQIACRRCSLIMTTDTVTYRFRCGDVYCRECTYLLLNQPESTCYGCHAIISGSNRRHDRLHISYT